jgi:hypothetical protein
MAASVKSKLFIPVVFILAILVASCGQAPAATSTVDTVATIVAATMQALTPQNALETPTAAPALPELTATVTPITTTANPLESGTPSITATPGMGIVTGGVYGYPYGSIPRLIFVAFNQDNRHWNYVINVAGLSYYSIDLTEGKYQIVAYDAAGHAGGCTTIVTVKDKETVTCDITNWNGSYPAKPGDAPNP